uniref:Polyketide synthase n=1 Tax=Myxococcus virescens TaxID=83456 RepID=A0A0N7ATF0_9BACT|nr:polyketide synthase [Myxococcus virescens]
MSPPRTGQTVAGESEAVLERALQALEAMEERLRAAEQARHEPIAIVGMSCRFPGASSPSAFWQMLRNGTDGISEVPASRWPVDAFYDPDPDRPGKMASRWGGFIDGVDAFDAHFFRCSPAEAAGMDPQQRLFLDVAWEALEDAAQPLDELSGTQTGIFVGAMTNDYAQLQDATQGLKQIDAHYAIGTEFSFIAGRVAHLLGVRGPCMMLSTACSSSLVALHLATRSLRSGESDLSVVGGVNVILSPRMHVASSKLRVMAANGRCKTFDASADGYVRGEGCGVVVLKRLSDAVKQGDRIHAVIRGTAVNHDGPSSGLTVPSSDAQAAVIRSALADAGADSATLTLLEAHGSGTPLGDAIEIEGIRRALGAGLEDRRPPLLVGSVKTNVGHLEAAAGMAGLFKVVLALRNGEVPPHLHLKQLNPQLNMSGLQVPVRLGPWPDAPERPLAGVSSFGLSGINAHVVVEAPPAPRASGPARPLSLLLLSARSENALEQNLDAHAAFLKAHPEVNVSDVAFTLQTGRKRFESRCALVCGGREEALRILETREPKRLLRSQRSDSRSPVIFMFPGLGDQHVGMGRRLYETEPVFRKWVDAGADLLQPLLGQDIRPLLHPAGAEAQAPATRDPFAALRRGRAKAAPDASPLYETRLAQPSLFVVEHALARLWMHWGVRPDGMIGYSLGELVAACLAGVLSFEDAIRLVAKRAELISPLPQGASLAVMLSEAQLRPIVESAGCAMLAVNSPGFCVATGPVDAVDGLEATLATRGITSQRVRTGHAFHSFMMEPVRQPLTEFAAQLTLRPPQIPYVSNVTGTWLREQEATDPGYWAEHLCKTVRFSEGLRALAAHSAPILMELGPGRSLSTLVHQHGLDVRHVLASLPSQYEEHADDFVTLEALGQLWMLGASIDWRRFHEHEQRQPLGLPTYPFQRQRYWRSAWGGGAPEFGAPPAQPQAEAERPQAQGAPSKLPFAQWFHAPLWKQAPRLPPGRGDAASRVLVFLPVSRFGQSVVQELRRRGMQPITVEAGDGFARLGDSAFGLSPTEEDHYEQLLEALGGPPGQVLHIASTGRTGSRQERAEATWRHGFQPLVLLARALGRRARSTVRLVVATDSQYAVSGTERLLPESALLAGPCRVIPLEYFNLRCHQVDVSLGGLEASQWAQHAACLVDELSGDTDEPVVAYRGGQRFVQHFERLTLTAPPQPLFRPEGVYLVTGGLGGLGLAIAAEIAKTPSTRLVLLGRSGLPPRETWEHILNTDGHSALQERIRAVRELEASGAAVHVVEVDVSDGPGMRQALQGIRERFGQVHGVVHAAGVPGAGMIQRKDLEEARRVLAPKLDGLIHLEPLWEEGPAPDFVCLFSSSIALSGGIGEVDYCAANAYLDAFARELSRRGIRALSINWGPWKWDAWQGHSVALPEAARRWFRHLRDTYGLTMEEGQRAWRELLSAPTDQALVAPAGLKMAIDGIGKDFLQELASQGTQSRHPRPPLLVAFVAPRDALEERIAAAWQDALGIESVGVNDNFFDLGGQSLGALQVISRINSEMKTTLPGATLFEAPTVAGLARLLRQERDDSQLDEDRQRGAARRMRRNRHHR